MNTTEKTATRTMAHQPRKLRHIYPKQTPNERRDILSPKVTTDDKETVTFERWRIRQLLDQMDALKEKLLRFEKLTVPREGK
jgi:hypothetical protein